jgi:hypothetical protein
MNDNNTKPAPLQAEAEQALTAQLNEAAAKGLPFPVGGALTSIKTLLERDPCSHAKTAIAMIDAILLHGCAAQPVTVQNLSRLEPFVHGLGKAILRELMGTPPAAQPAVPAFTTVAAKKLTHLQADGYQVNGYSLERIEDDGSAKRGAVTAGGMVLWWPGQLVTRQCQWEQIDNEHMPDTWQGACGAVWTFTDGGPKENDQTYCPKCGGVCIEVADAPEKGGAA